MTPWNLFETWAPPPSPWARWAKPVLFAELNLENPHPPAESLVDPNYRLQPDSAIVVDLPGPDSVKEGIRLAMAGFRPVPLYNAVPGPLLSLGSHALINMAPVMEWLAWGADILRKLHIPIDAPPAFLLDARRQKPDQPPQPGRFDNRWLIFPQDFPSARFLIEHQIRHAILIQANHLARPESDLSHVLLRWQQAGLSLQVTDPSFLPQVQPLTVPRPSLFRSLWYNLLALAGLRRNSAGGFGSFIPQSHSGG